MRIDAGRFMVRLAESDDDVAAAQRLRYRVFIEEMGAHASPEEARERRERDRFDPYFEHLLVVDTECADPEIEHGVVGAYRLMRGARARQGIGFYGHSEYDLSLLEQYPRETLEVGRSCIDAAYRGGTAMHLLFAGLGQYIIENDIAILFGVASFHGDDPAPFAQALTYLHHAHLAPPELRVAARPGHRVEMNILRPDQVDRALALRQIPPLIKGYIRLGAYVGDGAYIDRDFNTVDVCIVVNAETMADRYRKFYVRQRSRDGGPASD